MKYTRRYELTETEWEQSKDLLPPERTGRKGKPRKDNRQILNAMIWLALPERFGSWGDCIQPFP